MPMHANWQARFFDKCAGPVSIKRRQDSVADFANRVMGGR
jgi:hypothetical protein